MGLGSKDSDVSHCNRGRAASERSLVEVMVSERGYLQCLTCQQLESNLGKAGGEAWVSAC